MSQSRHLVHLLRVPSTMYNICVVAMGLCKGVALVKEIDIINYCARPIWYWTCWFLSTDIHFPYQTVPQYPFIRTAPSGAEYLLFASPSHAPSFFVRTVSTGFQSFCFPLGAAMGTLLGREGRLFIWLPLCRMVMDWLYPSPEGHSSCLTALTLQLIPHPSC